MLQLELSRSCIFLEVCLCIIILCHVLIVLKQYNTKALKTKILQLLMFSIYSHTLLLSVSVQPSQILELLQTKPVLSKAEGLYVADVSSFAQLMIHHSYGGRQVLNVDANMILKPSQIHKPFYGYHSGQSVCQYPLVKNCRILPEQSFTARVLLLMAASKVSGIICQNFTNSSAFKIMCLVIANYLQIMHKISSALCYIFSIFKNKKPAKLIHR